MLKNINPYVYINDTNSIPQKEMLARNNLLHYKNSVQVFWKTYLQRLWTMPKIYPSLYFHHFSSLSLGTSPWTSRTFLLCRSRTSFSSASWCLLSTWISCALQIQFYFHSYSTRHRQQNSLIKNIIHPNDSNKISIRRILQISLEECYYYHKPFEFKLWSSNCSFSPLAVPSNIITRKGKHNYWTNTPCLDMQSTYWEPSRGVQST